MDIIQIKNIMRSVKSFQKSTPVILLLLFGLTGIVMQSCESELGEIYKNPENELVYSFLKLDENKEDFSILVEALDKSGLDGMLNSYGTYTFFAANNTGFENYFAAHQIAGLDDIDSTELREILVYHILNKVREIIDFDAGFSTDTTAAGDYLAFDMSKGEGEIFINGKAQIIKINQRVSNGILHQVDNVLDPPDFTIWNYLSSRSKYGIITAALKEAGLNELLKTDDLKNGKLNSTLTCFAETDEVFKNEGINSLADLKSKLSAKGSDLDEFANYHIISGKKLKGAYFSFMIQNESLETLKGLRINANLDFGLVLNQWWGTDGTQNGVRFSESGSDIFAKNGVFHSVDRVMFVPEEQELEPIIRECEYGIILNESTGKYEADEDLLATWTAGTDVFLESEEELLRYKTAQKDNYITFTFENIIPGKYNVILGYFSSSAYAKAQLYIDGTPFGDIIDYTQTEDNNEVVIGPKNNEVVIGPKEFFAFGDYDFKFVHVTNGDGLYDYIKLDPISD